MRRESILAERSAWSVRAETDDDPWRLTTGDAAQLLHVTREMVRKYVRQRRLTCIHTPRGIRLFQESEVQRLVDERAYLTFAPPAPTTRRSRRGGSQLRLRLFESVTTRRKAG